jgi:DNA repair protein RecN (Recombination protein N)
MILELAVRNVSLIPELRLTLEGGLTVLTGETGAGKSILLGALTLLLGDRASADTIRSGCESAGVEALFDTTDSPTIADLLERHGLPPCEDAALVVKREISRTGRGKCFVNGGLTTVAVLAELGAELVDLHGQHEHQSLLQRHRQRDLLDAWGGSADLRRGVAEGFARVTAARQARERLAMDEAERVRRLDLLNFQISEIDGANVVPGEREALTEERGRLANAERLLGTVQEARERLHGDEAGAVETALGRTVSGLSTLAAYDARFAAWADALHAAEVQVADVAAGLADYAEGFEADPARLEAVEERLDALQKLLRKYGGSEESVLEFRAQAATDRDGLLHHDEELERLAREEQELTARLAEQARKLSQARTRAAKELAARVAAELKQLGFSQAIFEVRVEPRTDPEGWLGWEGRTYRCTASGVDEVEFFIGPNPGEAPKPVAKTASGGELSRIMLALKVVAASAAGVPTMIFDEIDAGIGGATADAVGRKLSALAAQRQVIVITHLPQIARFAGRHFQVSKKSEHGRTATGVAELSGEGRVVELARLLSGEPVTTTALQHARELIEKR